MGQKLEVLRQTQIPGEEAVDINLGRRIHGLGAEVLHQLFTNVVDGVLA